MKNLASNVLTIGYWTYKAFEMEMKAPFLFFVPVLVSPKDLKSPNKSLKYKKNKEEQFGANNS